MSSNRERIRVSSFVMLSNSSWSIVAILYLSMCDVCAMLVGMTDRECPTSVDPRIFFSGTRVPTGIKGRAKQTVPKEFILGKSGIQFAGLGIFSSTFLPKYTWLGEYEGDFVPSNFTDGGKKNNGEYAWTISRHDHSFYYVDAVDERMGNWLRYINCARHMLEENVGSTQCYGRRYYLTIRDIVPGEELLVYYGPGYAKQLGIIVEEYFNRDFWTRSSAISSRPGPG